MTWRFVAAVAAMMVVSACNCNGGGKNDGGTGGGAGGGTGGAVDSGPAQMSLDDFCVNAGAGYRASTMVETRACGVPLLDSDFAHIQYILAGIIPESFSDLWAGSDCTVDGGLRQQMSKYIAAVNGGRLAYDAKKALECQLAGRRDGGFQATDFNGNLVSPCDQVWVGKVAVGGVCEASYECAGGNYCKPTSASTCSGTCQPGRANGQTCGDVDVCNPKSFCDVASADGGTPVCQPKLQLNDACDPKGKGTPCEPPLACFGPKGSEACTAPALMGQACTRIANVGSNCAEGTCVVAVTFDGGVNQGTGTCKPLAATGAACGDGTLNKARCGSCDVCAGDGGTCVPFGKEGYDCATSSDCLDTRFYYCDDTTLKCAFKHRTGQPCIRTLDSNDNEDPQGTCLFVDDYCSVTGDQSTGSPGLCKNLPKVGEDCTDGTRSSLSATCATGYCNATTGTGKCVANPTTGQACADSSPGFGPCGSANDFCDTRADAGASDPGTGIGVCHAALALGAGCDGTTTCASPGICPSQLPDGGTKTVCVAPLATGSPCSSNSECASNNCINPDGGTSDETCVNLLADGQPCTDGAECVSDFCDTGTHVCTAACGVIQNEAGGCMNYDLTSMTSYLTFSLFLGLIVFPRRRR
jgi:hypothetical protein